MKGTNHDHWIRTALRLAREARERGDEPFGALLVHGGVSIMEARNAINTANDITQHPELRLAARASGELEPEIISEVTLYTSTEPCPMCAGAIYIARIPRVVYGLAAASLWTLTHRPDEERRPARTEYVGPVLEEEARLVHDGFWDRGPEAER